MSLEIALDSALAHALNSAIQPKLVEVGWSTSADDSALSEYIILMLVNGKTQDQIASELSGDLLNLGPDDPGARDFSQWLFEQVNALNTQINGGATGKATANSANEQPAQAQAAGGSGDSDMGGITESSEANIPTGPKGMRNGGSNRPRDKRMLGHMAKAMDRTHDSVLHRVRPQGGNERINSRARGAPTGPRQIRGAARMQNGRPNNSMQVPMNTASNIQNMSPQNQMELFAMLEQQARMMEQMFSSQQQQQMMMGGMSGGFGQQQHQQGRSLFDRVQGNPHQKNGNFRNGQQAQAQQQPSNNQNTTEDTAMEVDNNQSKATLSPDTQCKFNLSCTNKDCIFAHQSPAAPAGAAIDVNDICTYGAACKNRKCTGRHPSPAQKIAHQTEQDCKFFPNCTNPHCAFRHPTTPVCRNGADCTTPDCKFIHVKTMCKFNPCLNPACTFKHTEGQKRGKFEDKVWISDSAKEHVSERKFIIGDENAEDLVVPGGADQTMDQTSGVQPEVAT